MGLNNWGLDESLYRGIYRGTVRVWGLGVSGLGSLGFRASRILQDPKPLNP